MDFLCIYEGVLAFIYSIYFIEIKAAIRFRILFIYSFRLVGRLVPGKIIGLAWILYTGTLAENDTGPPALTIIRNSLQTGRACYMISSNMRIKSIDFFFIFRFTNPTLYKYYPLILYRLQIKWYILISDLSSFEWCISNIYSIDDGCGYEISKLLLQSGWKEKCRY